MLIGYARVSTDDQNLDLQRDAFVKAGIDPENVLSDKLSGAKIDRPGLLLAIKRLRAGDELVVWRLDRLARSLRELIDLTDQVKAIGADFRSLTESIDTKTAVGKLLFHILGALAEFERNLTIERTHAGMASAKARGRVGGRKHYVQGEQLVAMKRALLADDSDPDAIAAAYGIKRRTLYNYVPRGREGLLERIASGEEPQP